MTRSASCVCGQLSVNLTGEPERVNMCNCSACQRRSGSAFQIGAWFRDERVTAISGERRVYKRLAAEGRDWWLASGALRAVEDRIRVSNQILRYISALRYARQPPITPLMNKTG